MAVLPIARMGHPVLAAPAQPVADPAAPEVRRLVADMIETMEAAPGIGLAAPQVFVPRRVVVFRVPGERAGGGADDGPVPLTVLINPEIEPVGDALEEGWEACLSVPGLMGWVPRHARIRYRGVGPDGAPVAREAAGFHARVVQHECDHVLGILYPERIRELGRFGFADEIRARFLPPPEAEAAQ